jgi:hypothetical protein
MLITLNRQLTQNVSILVQLKSYLRIRGICTVKCKIKNVEAMIQISGMLHSRFQNAANKDNILIILYIF